MTWVKLDDQMPDHPKLASAGPLGLAMQVAGLCYANRFLTRGFLSHSVVRKLLDWDGVAQYEDKDVDREGLISFAIQVYPWTIARRLVESGVWEELPEGFQIHDYHDFQPTPEEVADLKQKRQTAGKLGGKASALVKQTAKQVLEQTSSNGEAKLKPVPVPVPVPENLEARTPTHTFTKYLDRFHNSERSFRGVTAERLLEIAQEEGIEAETAGKLLADVWEWWQTVPPSKRWKIPTRGWRGWCRREVKFAKEAAAKAALNGQVAPAPPPLLTTEERMAKREEGWAEIEGEFAVEVP